MKRILIIGKNSYVGNLFVEWLGGDVEKYSIDKISVKGEQWKRGTFSKYDVILYLAGIVHTKETWQNRKLFYQINRDLTMEAAQKAKDEGVSQFIFFSSIDVYGVSHGVIDKTTPLRPKTAYGKSKKKAESLLQLLADDSFKVAIVRPPLIYGKGCKGDYPKLVSLAKNSPIFPKINNTRSMVHIDNLCEFLKHLIDFGEEGIFHPQNAAYVNVGDLVRKIAAIHGQKIYFTKILNPWIRMMFDVGIVSKLFGDLVYQQSLSEYDHLYRVRDFKESIILSELEEKSDKLRGSGLDVGFQKSASLDEPDSKNK